MIFTLFLIVVVACLLLGAPIFVIFSAVALFGWYMEGTQLSVVGTDIFRLSSNFMFITIPLFTFAGYLLSESNAPRRLVKLFRAFFGWMPGGLAIVTIVSCSVFTALTGASGVTIVALGALLYPALIHDRYSEKFALGLVTTGGSLGLLFAPSVPLILYGVVTETPIFNMFVAGALPAVLMILVLSLFSIGIALKLKIPRTPLQWSLIKESVWEAKWEIPLPLVVLGGIYGKIVSASEVAPVIALWIFIVEVFINREISYQALQRLIRESMVMVGSILIIVATAIASTNYFIDIDVPSRLFDFVQNYISSPVVFLIALNIFLLILGMILDIFSALVVTVPILIPIAKGYGIDMVHLGIIFLANMQIGYLTPPFGMGLFISSIRFKKSVLHITLACLPFIALLLGSVLIITYWSDLSLSLVRWVEAGAGK